MNERITINPAICQGKEILADYEDLEREDILAVLRYATRLSQVNRVELLAA